MIMNLVVIIISTSRPMITPPLHVLNMGGGCLEGGEAHMIPLLTPS
jgi:hypothetical protein